MLPDEIEALKDRWTDQYVIVDGDQPELARFRHMTGRVKTVNMNGRALVQFDGDGNRSWYDIHPSFLKIVDAPPPKAVEKPVANAAAKPKGKPDT